MSNIELINKTNNEKINKIISALLYLYDQIIPDKVLSIYIIGSYANKTSIKNSDLDMTVVLNENADKNDLRNMDKFTDNLNYISSVPLDISYYTLSELKDENKNLAINVLIKNGSYHIFGKDIKDEINFPNKEKYLRMCINRALYFISRVRNEYYNNGSFTYINMEDVINKKIENLDFPDKTQKFFGYTARTIEDSDGNEIPITKELILINSLIATTRLAEKGVYVGDKDSSLTKYKEVINDQWTENIEATYSFCREKYNYLIPEEESEQEKLIEICKKTLELENYFLQYILSLKLTD